MEQKSASGTMTRLYQAFEADGYKIMKAYAFGGRLGVMAAHRKNLSYDTGRGKRCYYVEGTPYERGYLLGLLSEKEMAQMAVQFTDNVIFDFLGVEFLNRFPLLQKLLVELLYELSEQAFEALPGHIHAEISGMLDGCKKANPRTGVTKKRLAVMNVAFDVLCALAYSGEFFKKKAPEVAPELIRLTMMCNAFSVMKAAAGGGHYFARDFMFASGGVFQNNLCHVIHVPAKQQLTPLYPYVSVTAPGMAGSISAMNAGGVAIGVNMSPGGNSNPGAVGLNSLLLARDAVLYGGDIRAAADVIANAERGVAWNYALSDGTLDLACTVEAGMSAKWLNVLSYPPPELRPLLPDENFLVAHPGAPMKNGAAVRWCDAPLPREYLSYNPKLWKDYQNTKDASIVLYPDAFAPDGFINRTPEQKNCPSSFYFAPERSGGDVHITGNHFLSPRMRLCAMDPWTAAVAKGNVNDIQWRYDALNGELRSALAEKGSIGYEDARRIADFLAPYGRYPEYYKNNPKSPDGKQTRIEGCVSLFDLKAGTVESHYGYYGDGWVKTTLPNYLPDE
ncbi:MAG TPA: hypothetical protein VN366_09600 [Feifaniaceae bacterium]|nr:hypothetical protein [Feifaniaceae bacterium]